jgi:hypothetical protein
MVVPGVETVTGCSLVIVAMLHSQSLQQLFGRAGGDPGGAFEHPTNLLEDFPGTFAGGSAYLQFVEQLFNGSPLHVF